MHGCNCQGKNNALLSLPGPRHGDDEGVRCFAISTSRKRLIAELDEGYLKVTVESLLPAALCQEEE